MVTSDTVAPVTRPSSHPVAYDLEVRTDFDRPAPTPQDDGGQASHRRKRLLAWFGSPAAVDLGICLAFLALASWLTHGLWPHPSTHAIGDNANDQALIEWLLAQGVLVWRGDFSFVTYRLNSPDGVNLMSNASHILHGVIMAPVTALFGAPVTFALLVALNLAGTAAAWYLLMVRCLRVRRLAAGIGAAFAGFAPGMMAQSHSHLHISAQWLIPLIVYWVIRLTRVTGARDTILTGTALGVTITAQALLGEEVLFLTALTLGLFSLVYAMWRRSWAASIAPQFLAGSSVAAGVAMILLAYPLWVQFRGPQHTPNAPFNAAAFYADVASYPLFSPLSIAGSADAGRLATSSAEYNTYLGLPIILIVVAVLIWRWRSPSTVAIGITAIVMTLLSFGPYVTLNGVRTGWPSLYNLIGRIPVVEGALPTRYALALIPLIGLLIALGVDHAAASPGISRFVVPVAVLAAMLPTFPLPIETATRAPVPQFISTGAWRQCAPEGGVIVPVPLPTPQQPDVMRWAAAADDAFAVPEGFFIGPYGPEGKSSIGKYPTGTSILLAQVAQTGIVPQIDANTRARAKADLAYWKADCVALAQAPNEDALHSTLDEMLGPGTAIADTWTWKVTR
jgi:hypothetical protein